MLAKYRNHLPQLSEKLFITDGGIETTLIFLKGFPLPYFASFVLLENERGTIALKEYYESYIALARAHGTGFILESATWRANADWGQKIGYSEEALARANMQAIALLHNLRAQYESDKTPMVVSGCVGPRGDGYKADLRMSDEEAEEYHRAQINIFRDAGADMVSAITMTYTAEAIGIVRAAEKAGMPVTISFTVETDGTLPSGEALGAAIETVDTVTNNGPVYYMINCAHPDHFKHLLARTASWTKRIYGIRANASVKSHAELDAADALDSGDPAELGKQYAELRRMLPHLNILGGCCGTDHRHVQQALHANLHG